MLDFRIFLPIIGFMSVIKGILREEYDRLRALRKNYISKIKVLPKGSLIVKKRGMRKYLYQSYRDERGKVVSLYLGLFNEINGDKISVIKSEIEQRKDLMKKYQSVGRQIKELERYVKGQ